MWCWLVDAIADRDLKIMGLLVVALLGITALLALFIMVK
jgi:hypothetical protein